jgi:uncharacterized protein YjbJ (UPF0337 family)
MRERATASSCDTTQPPLSDTLQIKGHWNIIKGRLKQHWAKLTDVDLHFVQGKQRALVERIEESTGPTRAAVEKAIKVACASRRSATIRWSGWCGCSVNDRVSDKMIIKFNSPNTSPNWHARQVRRGLELGRASGGTKRCAKAPPQSGKAS